MMNKADNVVRNLLDALDRIARAADTPHPTVSYIQGMAEQAIRNAHAEMTRNSDGYLVVKPEPAHV